MFEPRLITQFGNEFKSLNIEYSVKTYLLAAWD